MELEQWRGGGGSSSGDWLEAIRGFGVGGEIDVEAELDHALEVQEGWDSLARRQRVTGSELGAFGEWQAMQHPSRVPDLIRQDALWLRGSEVIALDFLDRVTG